MNHKENLIKLSNEMKNKFENLSDFAIAICNFSNYCLNHNIDIDEALDIVYENEREIAKANSNST